MDIFNPAPLGVLTGLRVLSNAPIVTVPPFSLHSSLARQTGALLAVNAHASFD